MKPVLVTYERLYSFGNHNNVKLGVTVQVEANESADDVLCEARAIVKRMNRKFALEEAQEARTKAGRDNVAKPEAA